MCQNGRYEERGATKNLNETDGLVDSTFSRSVQERGSNVLDPCPRTRWVEKLISQDFEDSGSVLGSFGERWKKVNAIESQSSWLVTRIKGALRTL